MISVIIPVYNTEPYLRHCLDSVVNQTYGDLEVILIDDGSSDGSPAILDEYAEKDSRFQVWHLRNGGVSNARNFGLTKSHGEWISFVDSDDWLKEDMFETLIDLADRTGADTVCCDAWQGTEETLVDRKIWRRFEGEECVYTGKDVLGAVVEQSGTLWNKLLNGDRARAMSFQTDIRYAEDVLYLTEYLENSKKVAACKKGLYCYRADREGNVVSRGLNSRHLDFIKATELYTEILMRHGCEQTQMERIVDTLVVVLSRIPLSGCGKCREYLESAGALARMVRNRGAGLLEYGDWKKQWAKRLMIVFAQKPNAVCVLYAKVLARIR